MTREQYLELKEELKQTSKNLRWNKHMLRANMRAIALGIEYPIGLSIARQQGNLLAVQRDFRVKHIMMSLLRGRTRIQIENNFESQMPKNGLYSYVERDLKAICEKYDLDMDLDQNYKVMTVEIKKLSTV